MSSREVCELAFPNGPHVSYNLPFWEVIGKYGSKMFIIASGSLSRNTDALQRLKIALGDTRVAGVYQDVQPHTLWSQVLEIVDAIQISKPDTLVTLGAGSLTDAAKVAALVSFLHSLRCRAFHFCSKLIVFDIINRQQPMGVTRLRL
jgi:alcohol dehydrogenase YqhD (iron-dependent ADH family)